MQLVRQAMGKQTTRELRAAFAHHAHDLSRGKLPERHHRIATALGRRRNTDDAHASVSQRARARLRRQNSLHNAALSAPTLQASS